MTAPFDPKRAEALISGSLIRLRSRSPFLGTLALYARWIPDPGIATACTNGREIRYSPAFFATLSPRERDFVVGHEVLHVALRHVARRGPREPKKWNIAADIVVNGICEQAGLQPMRGSIRDKKLEDLRVEDVFARLPDVSRSRQAKLGAKVGQKLRDLDPKAASTGSVEADRRWEAYWRQALQRAALADRLMQSGSPGLGAIRELAGVLEPKMDWRTMLWRYVVKTPTDYAGFDRRFIWRGLYLDQLDGERLDVHICVDTSGSIRQEILERFVGEVRGICACHPHVNAQLWYADASVYGPWQVNALDEIPPPQGGGGTDFRPFFRAIADPDSGGLAHETVAVYLTDGFGSFPQTEPDHPVLWVAIPGGRDKFPFGEMVKMEEPR